MFHTPEGAGDAESFRSGAASRVGASLRVLAPAAGPLGEPRSLQGMGPSWGHTAFTRGHFSSSPCVPGGAVGKNLSAKAGGTGSIPESGRSPGGGDGNPLQYCRKSHGQSLEGYHPRGCKDVGHNLAIEQR